MRHNSLFWPGIFSTFPAFLLFLVPNSEAKWGLEKIGKPRMNFVWKALGYGEGDGLGNIRDVEGSFFQYVGARWNCVILSAKMRVKRNPEDPFKYTLSVWCYDDDEASQHDFGEHNFDVSSQLRVHIESEEASVARAEWTRGISWSGEACISASLSATSSAHPNSRRVMFVFSEDESESLIQDFTTTLASSICRADAREDTVSEARLDTTMKSFSSVMKAPPAQQQSKTKPTLAPASSSSSSRSSSSSKLQRLNLLSSAEIRCKLYMYQSPPGEFSLAVREAHVGIVPRDPESDDFEYVLYVRKGPVESVSDYEENMLIESEVTEQMQPVFDYRENTFTWFQKNQQRDEVYQFRIACSTSSEYVQFRNFITQHIWETTNQLPFSSLPKANRTEILENAELIEDEVDNLAGILEELDLDMPEFEDGSEDEKEEEEYSATSSIGNLNGKNRYMSQAMKYERAFVSRDNQIGVFKTNDGVKFKATLDNVIPGEIGQMMLHDGDQSLLLRNSGKSSTSIYHVDLNRPDVVQEWKTGPHSVQQLYQKNKYNQISGDPIVLGLNEQGTFMIDQRLPGVKTVDSKALYFARGVGKSAGFTCAASTGQGDVIIGSDTGDIRLFSKNMWDDKSSKNWTMKTFEDANVVQGDGGEGNKLRARTRLPSKGVAITGIDVTEDGSLAVCTTNTFLLVISTVVPSTGKNGFERAMGKDKPVPIELRLNFKDCRMLGGNVKFTPAKFNMSETGERFIVTSTGPCLITWSFKFKNYRLTVNKNYRIKKFGENVVADEFRYKDDGEVLVALENDVRSTKFKK